MTRRSRIPRPPRFVVELNVFSAKKTAKGAGVDEEDPRHHGRREISAPAINLALSHDLFLIATET